MSSTPYMQLYVGDYLSDTLHLTTEQHGAYLLLLMTMWRAGASLPNDPAKLARICRVSPKRWPAIWAEISAFFVEDGDTLSNERLTKEHQKAVSISQERKTAGSKGGTAKALKNKDAGVANAVAGLKHSQKSESDIDTEANASDADASPDEPDFRDEIWTRGVAYLQRKGIAERNARTVIGKWIKDHGDAAVFSAFEAASRERPVEPVAWITARLGAPPKQAVDMDAIWKSLETGATQ